MSENIILTIAEKHVTFNPVVKVKIIEPRKNNLRVLKSNPMNKQFVRPKIGLQFVK